MTFNDGQQAITNGSGADTATANGINRKTFYRSDTAPSFTVDSVSFPENGTLWLDTSTTPPTPKVYDGVNAEWKLLIEQISPDISVYPHSTEIADYSTPSDATASSEGASDSQTINATGTNLSMIAGGGVTRAGVKVNSASSVLVDFVVSRVTVRLHKSSSPTGEVKFRIRNSGDTIQRDEQIVASAADLTTSYLDYTVSFSPYTIQNGDRLLVEWLDASGGQVRVEKSNSDVFDGTNTIRTHFISSYTDTTTDDVYMVLEETAQVGDAIDDDTGTTWESDNAANPWLRLDITGDTDAEPSAIALWTHSNTTETQIKIQTSPDGSAWTDKRTINIVDLTHGQYNFIRFNRGIEQIRYLRIFGNSGDARVLAISEIKVLSPTESQWNRRHGHKPISATETGVPLEG